MIFEYTDMNKRPAHCDIEKIGNIIIMTELASNTGASVTNSCAYIAQQYAEQGNSSINDFIFIERYDNRSYESPQLYKEEKFPNYTLVTFTGSDTAAIRPHWQHLPEDKFYALIEK